MSRDNTVAMGADGCSERLSVVLIYADDLGWGDLGCFGAQHDVSPNIDALASNGIRCPNWYSNSPVCSPSRASLLTGRYPENAGVFEILGGERHVEGLPQQSTLASLLGGRGFATGIFGKWHLGTSRECWPDRFGFDEHFGFLAGCLDYYSHIYYWGAGNPVHDLWDQGEEVWQNGRYLTDEIADRASEFIVANRDRPFFCYVPFNAPHYPMHAPAQFVERFASLPDDQRMTAAMIAAMDAAIGRILAAISQAGIASRTIVIFSSDNGPSTETRNWLNGEEVSYQGGSAGGLRGHKGAVFEGGVRVPLVVSCPGRIPAGEVRAEPGIMMDLVPTLLDATGEGQTRAGAGDIDGVSLWRYWTDGEIPAPRALHWDCEEQWGLRSGRWKLVVDAREVLGGPSVLPVGLFDLEQDPAERDNLLSEHPQVALELAGLPAVPTWARAKVQRAVATSHESARAEFPAGPGAIYSVRC